MGKIPVTDMGEDYFPGLKNLYPPLQLPLKNAVLQGFSLKNRRTCETSNRIVEQVYSLKSRQIRIYAYLSFSFDYFRGKIGSHFYTRACFQRDFLAFGIVFY
jgi:hypothetical protein